MPYGRSYTVLIVYQLQFGRPILLNIICDLCDTGAIKLHLYCMNYNMDIHALLTHCIFVVIYINIFLWYHSTYYINVVSHHLATFDDLKFITIIMN